MNIQNINLTDGIITITLDANATVNKVYIDTLYNSKNKYSNVDNDHTYVVVDPSVVGKVITIDSKDFASELDSSAFTVLINGTLGFYYDDKELYYKEIELLTSYCSTCLDKQQKEKMVLFTLRYQLLQYAVENNKVEDQIEHYKDLARMLNIDLQSNVQQLPIGKVSGCVSCYNGTCQIC